MAIYGFGAYYDCDVSSNFIHNNIVGVGWSYSDAPELHNYVRSLKVGDIIYIKAAAFGVPTITVKAIGFIIDSEILDAQGTHNLVAIGRNVLWFSTRTFHIPKPTEKNNVRNNTIYEEFHPEVQNKIMAIFQNLNIKGND